MAVAIVAVALLPETAPGLLGFVSSVAAGAAVGAAIGGVSTSILGGDMGQGILTGAISGAIFGGIGSFGLSGRTDQVTLKGQVRKYRPDTSR